MSEKFERFAFSNFERLSTPLVYGGVSYPTVEHFYQAMKTDVPEERARIAAMRTAREAKSAGKRPWQPKFDRVKVMRFALEKKFKPGTPEAKRLMSYPGPLVEWNYWHDQYWGKCVCGTHNGVGTNMLGQLLTEIRSALLRGVQSTPEVTAWVGT